MVSGAWLPDPTRPGRLRYWDGARWTEHVSAGGVVESEPVAGDPPPPPDAGPAPVAAPIRPEAPEAPEAEAPSAPPAPTGGVYPPTVLGRAGFALAAAGGVLIAATAGSTAVDQGAYGYIEVAGGSWIGIVAAVLCVGAAAAPWTWARVAGVGVSSFFAILVAFALIGFRTSEDLLKGEDVTLAAAGWLMLAGSLLMFAGTAVALAGLRRPARGPDPASSPREGKAVASLVLSVTSLMLPFLAAPGVALGLLAGDDVRATDGRVTGRGVARAGVVVGITSLALWGLGLLLGMLLAQP